MAMKALDAKPQGGPQKQDIVMTVNGEPVTDPMEMLQILMENMETPEQDAAEAPQQKPPFMPGQ